MTPSPPAPLQSELLDRCPICGSRERRVLMDEADRPGGFLARLVLHECPECGAIYLSPRLSSEAMEKVEDVSEVYEYEEDQIEELIQGPLNGLVAWLEGFQKDKRGAMLDVGCNRGFLLEAARRRGWRVQGIELSQIAAEQARRRYGVHVSPSLAHLGQNRRFALITLWHVLEHLPDPGTWLRALRSRLTADGLLAIQVPSFDFYEEFVARQERDSILCSVHNFYYTEGNLPPLLSRCGYDPFHIDNNPDSLLLTILCRPRPLTLLERIQHQCKFVGWRGPLYIKKIARYSRRPTNLLLFFGQADKRDRRASPSSI